MKPILFNTEMVRAILDGRKTVTRRCVKYKYSNTEMQMRTDKYGTSLIEIQKDVEGETFGKNEDGTTWRKLLAYIEKVPPFKVNDILYVRETYFQAVGHYLDVSGESVSYTYPIFEYLADGKHTKGHWYDKQQSYYMVKRPSIHMPKEAARIFLKVTGVRVERLEDITQEDAIKEGVMVEEFDKEGGFYERDEFLHLWNSTIKKDQLQYYGWDANPYVWVIEFEVIDKEAAMAAGMVVLKENGG